MADFWRHDKAESELKRCLRDDDYAVYDPDFHAEDGKIQGLMITQAGHVMTFFVDSWGPDVESATHQGHVDGDGPASKYRDRWAKALR